MAAATPLKNHPPWKEWIPQTDPLKEVSMVKKVMAYHNHTKNGWLQ